MPADNGNPATVVSVKINDEQASESFKQEAMASWNAYREAGRHLTGQEVRAWLNAWGTAAETKLPECHR